MLTRDEADDRPVSPFTVGEAVDEDDEPDDTGYEQPLAPGAKALPSDAVDLVKEDMKVVEEAQVQARRSGEPHHKAPAHVFHHNLDYLDDEDEQIEEVYQTALPEDRRTSDAVTTEDIPGGDPVEQIERLEKRITTDTPSFDRHDASSPFGEANPWA